MRCMRTVYENGIGVDLMRSHAPWMSVKRGERALEHRHVERVNPLLPVRVDDRSPMRWRSARGTLSSLPQGVDLLFGEHVTEHLERARIAEVMTERVHVRDHEVDDPNLERLDLFPVDVAGSASGCGSMSVRIWRVRLRAVLTSAPQSLRPSQKRS